MSVQISHAVVPRCIQGMLQSNLLKFSANQAEALIIAVNLARSMYLILALTPGSPH